MNLVEASSKRVAWAWLDNLFGKAPPAPAREMGPPRATTPQERERLLSDAYESIKGVLVKAIGDEVSALVRETAVIANRHGIDPVFLNWYLLNGKHWPPMPTRARQALQAVRSIHLWYGAVPDSWRDMQVPAVEQGRARDAALRAVADWFVKIFLERIERKYVNAVWKKSREIARAVAGSSGKADPKASLLLMRDFERRLSGDRFQLKPAVQKVVDLFE